MQIKFSFTFFSIVVSLRDKVGFPNAVDYKLLAKFLDGFSPNLTNPFKRVSIHTSNLTLYNIDQTRLTLPNPNYIFSYIP